MNRRFYDRTVVCSTEYDSSPSRLYWRPRIGTGCSCAGCRRSGRVDRRTICRRNCENLSGTRVCCTCDCSTVCSCGRCCSCSCLFLERSNLPLSHHLQRNNNALLSQVRKIRATARMCWCRMAISRTRVQRPIRKRNWSIGLEPAHGQKRLEPYKWRQAFLCSCDTYIVLCWPVWLYKVQPV